VRGTIVKRGRAYSVVVERERDPLTGKRRREWHSGYRTKREAEDARIRILAGIERGEHVEPSQLTFGAFLTERWLPARVSSLRPSTLESYGRNVRVHIVPGIGSVRLQGITADMLNAFYANRLTSAGRDATGLSPRTVRYLHSIIHRALADALRWGLVVRNVADAADPPSQKATRAPAPTTWSAAELRGFLRHVEDERLYPLWLLYATTGLRRGEALGLRWSELDLENGRAAISEARVTVGYEVRESTPKTDRGRRSVALDTATVAALRGTPESTGRRAAGIRSWVRRRWVRLLPRRRPATPPGPCQQAARSACRGARRSAYHAPRIAPHLGQPRPASRCQPEGRERTARARNRWLHVGRLQPRGARDAGRGGKHGRRTRARHLGLQSGCSPHCPASAWNRETRYRSGFLKWAVKESNLQPWD
jgi:integrase